MVYAKFGGQTECIMGNWKIENSEAVPSRSLKWRVTYQTGVDTLPYCFWCLQERPIQYRMYIACLNVEL